SLEKGFFSRNESGISMKTKVLSSQIQEYHWKERRLAGTADVRFLQVCGFSRFTAEKPETSKCTKSALTGKLLHAGHPRQPTGIHLLVERREPPPFGKLRASFTRRQQQRRFSSPWVGRRPMRTLQKLDALLVSIEQLGPRLSDASSPWKRPLTRPATAGESAVAVHSLPLG